MTTEVLGFLIILGMLVVVVLNRQIWQRREPGAPADDMEEATRRLRREMEQSADEIISRMGAQIDHLEHLVAEADKRARRLERQLEEMRDAAERHEEEAPQRYRNGFEKMLAASMATDEQTEPPLHRTKPPAAAPRRRPPVTWAEPGAMPADMVEHQSPPVELAPSLEVVVAPSVADVVDLPLDPEEGEMTWTAADDRETMETAYPSPGAYATYPTTSERAGDFGTPAYEVTSAYPPAPAAYPEYPAEVAEVPAHETDAAAYLAAEPAAVYEAASYPEKFETENDTETAGESRITATQPVDEVLPASMGREAAEPYSPYPVAVPPQAEASSMMTMPPEPEAGPPIADDETWGGETMPMEMGEEPAAPSGVTIAEDGMIRAAEESVWTEEDEEDAIESQQVAEVLQGSRTSASSRAREMLEQGRSADEVARELHMGRNAIELIAQMVHRKQTAPH